MAILPITIYGHERTANLHRAVRHCPFCCHPPPSGKQNPKLWKTGHANTGISIREPVEQCVHWPGVGGSHCLVFQHTIEALPVGRLNGEQMDGQ